MTKVLVVDDSADIIGLLRTLLEAQGYEVSAAQSGPEALEVASARRPDVILSDVMMPGMDGIEVCRRLKADAELRIIPVILATGKDLDQDVVQGLDAGADDYVTKPFNKDILTARLRSAVRVKKSHDMIARINERLEAEIGERRRVAEGLRKRTHELGERVKELNCLYGVSRLLQRPGVSVQEAVRETVALIPSGWQHPEITCARIVVRGEVVETDNFEETPWKQDAPIFVNNRHVGTVEVAYLKDRPKRYEGPFSKEERALVDSIAEHLGQFIEHDEAQAEVRALEQQTEFILGATKTGLCIVDSHFNLRYVDPEWQKVYGDPSGKKCHEYFQCQAEACADCAITSAMKTKKIAVREQTLPKEDNRPVQCTVIPFQNEKEEWLYAEVNVDISERKRMERELAQAQKLESIGRLAAGIAHEINTPTQYIGDNTRFLQETFDDLDKLLGAFDRLLGAVKDDAVTDDLVAEVEATLRSADVDYLTDEIPRAIQQSLEGVDRVAKLVRSMKEFSHPGNGRKQAVDLNRAVENALTVSRNEWKYVADVVTDFDPSLPPVSCLPGDFNQVILNVIVNAAQAIGSVVGDGSERKGTITARTRLDGNWAEIRIIDTGPGIPEEIRSNVFDHFFTTKEVGKGTGQGLCIARSIVVDKHGGTIAFETELGKGTAFIIRLPITDEFMAMEDLELEQLEAFC